MSARAFSLVEDQWAETTVNRWVFKHSHWWRISGRRLQSIDECSSILIGGGSVGAETTSVNQWVFKHSHWWRISGRRLQSIDECSSVLIGGGSVGGDYISQSMSVQVLSLVEDQWAETISVNQWVVERSHWWRISGRRLQSINECSRLNRRKLHKLRERECNHESCCQNSPAANSEIKMTN